MANISKVLNDIFFGTDQSKYAALAIFITIAILCFFILGTASDMSIGQRIVIIFFILLTAVPSILFSLFELTCIVTGGTASTRWWCYWLAWFITIVIVLYCLFIIISMFLSMASYDIAMTTIEEKEQESKVSKTEANDYAKNIMMNNESNENARTAPKQSIEQHYEESYAVQHAPVEQAPVEQAPVEQAPQSSSRMFDNQNSLDSMGYDSSDMYASISGFENAPTQQLRKAQEHKVDDAESGVPEPFSLQSNFNELAASVSSAMKF